MEKADNVIRFRAHPRLVLRLIKIAKAKCLNRSEIVRNAISEYLEREEKKSTQT